MNNKWLFSPPSSCQALSAILGRREFYYLKKEISDWRLWFNSAASRLNITEEQLMNGLAKMIKIPFVNELANLKKDNLIETKRFLDSGACIIKNNDLSDKIICLDPYLIRKIISKNSWQTISLGCWSQISKANVAIKNNSFLKLENDIEEAVFLFLTEAESYGSSTVKLYLESKILKYEFLTSENKKAIGEISISVADKIVKVLNDTINSGISNCTAKDFNFVLSKKNNYFYIEILKQLPKRMKNILLIEDDQIFAKIAKHFLERENFSCLHTSDAHQALDYIHSNVVTPDIVICDLHLTNSNAFYLIQEIRRSEQTKKLPVIILTGDESVEAELEAINSGANAFLSKNRDPRILMAQIKNLLYDN